MRKYVKEFIRKIPKLEHSERLSVKEALAGVDDYDKICDLIESRLERNPVCPHCSGRELQKFGKSCGLQRYRCKECGRTFNALTGTPLAKLRKKELWLKNLQHMLDSTPLRKIAEDLSVDLKTAFKWRHRFCEWLKGDNPKQLTGIVEADETYFLKSQKGCKKLRRKPRKRGCNIPTLEVSKHHVCIFTAKDRSGHGFEHVAGAGMIKSGWLNLKFSELVDSDITLITDNAKAYKKFCRENSINHVGVPPNRKCGAGGVYHIQRINSYHERLKTWINRKFRGVATKYLHHYLWWRHELENKHITDPVSLLKVRIKLDQQKTGT